MRIKKAMIFAAGFGTRLRPLTNVVPKPLVPILNRPLLEHHLESLASLGVEEIAVNLHYLPEKIEEHLGDGSRWGVRIVYSLETPDLLGTGGGLAKLRDFFIDEPTFLVVNGDILHKIDLKAALNHHYTQNKAATLILRPHPGDPEVGSIGVDEAGNVLRVPEMEEKPSHIKRMYTGLQILTPTIFQYFDPLPPPPSCILRVAYRRMLEAGHTVSSYFSEGDHWCDIGNPKSYWDAQFDLLKQSSHSSPFFPDATINSPVCIGENVHIGKGVTIGPYAIIGDHSVISDGAKVQHSVLWPHSKIAPNSVTNQAIIYQEKEQIDL